MSNPYQSPNVTDVSERDKSQGAAGTEGLTAWEAIAPFIALLAGPGIVVFFWALEVYALGRSSYVSNYERLDELWPALPIGVIGGVVGFMIVAARVWLK